jgi:hypothetical protein
MTPERVTERVNELIESICHGTSRAFVERNAAQTFNYINQVHHLGIIDAVQVQALMIAVNEVANSWRPKVDLDGVRLEG